MSYRTAWLIKHKLMQAMALAESDQQLTGRVEVDDAYLGGERSGGRAGRGSENKVPIVVAVQTTEDERAHLVCLSARPFTKEAMKEFIATSMGLPLTVVSDGLGCFTVATSMGAVNHREVTGGGKASAAQARHQDCCGSSPNQERLIKSMIANAHAAIQYVRCAAEQLPKIDRWTTSLGYICQRIVSQTSLPTPPPALAG